MENEQIELLRHSNGFICIYPDLCQTLIVIGALLVLCVRSLKAFLRFSVLGISRRRPVTARVDIYNGPQNTTFRLEKDHLGELFLVFAWYLHVTSIENVSKHC